MRDSLIPVFEMPYPERPLNGSMPEAWEKLQQWLRRHRIINTAEAWNQVRRTRPELMAARYYPDADPESLVRHTCWIAWAFIVDDELDDGPAGRDAPRCRAAIVELIDAVTGGVPRGPYSRALSDLWHQTVDGRSREWCRIHLADLCDWLWTYHTEAVRRQSGRAFTLREYVPFRCHSIAMLLYGADHVEASLRLDLPEFVRHLPALDRIRHLASEHIGLLNDIFSITKDQCLDNSNAVHIAMGENCCDLPSAVGHVNTLLTERIYGIAEQEVTLTHQLQAAGTDPGTQEQVATCVEALKSLIRGNHDWHFEVTRYSAPEAVRNGMPLYTEDLFANQSTPRA